MNNLNTAILKLCDYKNIYRSFKYNKNPKKNIMISYVLKSFIYLIKTITISIFFDPNYLFDKEGSRLR
jgi:hypothetical protein